MAAIPQDPLRLLLLNRPGDQTTEFLELVGSSGDEYALTGVTTAADTVAALVRGTFDAVVIPAAAAAEPDLLRRVRDAAAGTALVVLRDDEDAVVPLDPQDVGVQSTLEAWTLDRQTLYLTLSLAVERQRLADVQALSLRQAEQLAALNPVTDGLTGLPCGERLLEEVDRFLADAIRFHRPLTVGLLELDGLGTVRRRDGRGLADSLLVHAAGVMAQCLRGSDVLGRLGEDQLLVAMPGTGGDAAVQAARRIQRRLGELPYRGRVVQVSVGLASLEGLMAVDELVFAADTALHVAQRQGSAGLHRSSALSLG